MGTNPAKKIPYFNFKQKNTLIFFLPFGTFLSFFSRTPEILHLHFFLFPSTLWKFFFGHLDFFSSLSQNTYIFFFIKYTDTWHFFYSKKNLANVHPRTVDKFLSNIECNWHRNSFTIETTQSNIIEFIATRHTHTHIFFGRKKYELRTLNWIEWAGKT